MSLVVPGVGYTTNYPNPGGPKRPAPGTPNRASKPNDAGSKKPVRGSATPKDSVERAKAPQRPVSANKPRPISAFGERTKGSTETKKPVPPRRPASAQSNNRPAAPEKKLNKEALANRLNKLNEQRIKLKEEGRTPRQTTGSAGKPSAVPARKPAAAATPKATPKAAQRPVQKKTQPGNKGIKPRTTGR